MYLVLSEKTPPPEKRDWHNPDPSSRGDWNSIFETITAWFCSSHDFNKEDTLLIETNIGVIEFQGENLRYLGPSLRSAASLVSKAYDKLKYLSSGRQESTPGIFVYQSISFDILPKPFHKIQLMNSSSESNSLIVSENLPSEGTYFTANREDATSYYLPANTIPQAIVWLLQEVKT